MESINSTGAAGFGVGGLVGGGLLGLVVGSMLNNNGGLFGSNRTPSTEAVALGALEFMEQSGEIKAAAVASGAAAVSAVQQGQGAILTALASNDLTTLQSVNGLGNQITASNTQALIQNLNSFNQLGLVTQNGFNQSQMSQLESANDIKVSINSLAAQSAQCCCEIKSAIAVDGGATRSLINDIRLSDLQGQLTDAKMALSNSNQTNQIDAKISAMAATIISHLTPHHH